MKIKYSSNNSGGSWWLSDEDWYALEKAGWEVEWYKDQKERIFGKGERFLGALASYASKDFDSPMEAFREFEALTGACISDEGCNCCGAPHSFSWEDDSGDYHYASGEETLSYMYGNNQPTSLREALELLNNEDPE